MISIWERLQALQHDMFAAGPLSIKFAYFGREGALPSRPCITTRWVRNADDMADLMDKCRAHCVCGCYLNIGDILAEALNETRQGPVQAVIIVGDVFRGNPGDAVERANDLHAAGTRLFLFQQHSTYGAVGEDMFRTLAKRTGGAYFTFNPAVERVAERLPGLLTAVTHFAIGGTDALAALDDQSACLLLEQMEHGIERA